MPFLGSNFGVAFFLRIVSTQGSLLGGPESGSALEADFGVTFGAYFEVTGLRAGSLGIARRAARARRTPAT